MISQIRHSIILTLGLILVLQVAFLPVFVSFILAMMLFSLAFLLKKQKNMPKIWIFAFTILALLVVFWTHRSFLGVDAGVAVLSIFLFAKALETKDQRDLVIVFNFALFVAASCFLFSQSFFMAFGVFFCFLSCLLGLYQLQKSEFVDTTQQKTSVQHDLKHVAKFVAYAIPFFVLLFIFFPRLPPLWHIPIPENKAVTGISDSMSPGDIAELSQSNALAFRILGDMKKLPPRSELYWRALVLDQYDGQRWTAHFYNQQPLKHHIQPQKSGWDYQYLAADPSILWIMGLEKSIPLERRYYNRQDWGIVPQRLRQRNEPIALHWIANSVENDPTLLNFIQKLNTQTKTQYDPKAQALAQKLYLESQQDQHRYIDKVLNWYRKNQFSYTLTPGTLGQNRIDEFLFDSRRGFCEHFASSFVMLMRYVGIPARVVTGYQGGQFAPDGQSWEVRQLDAHAWTEVWLDGKWQRIDPTAIIAPQRIDQGMQNLIAQDENVGSSYGKQSVFLNKIRVWNDYASYQWQSKIVGYNAEAQRSWLSQFGFHSNYAPIFILVAGIALLLAIYLLKIYWQNQQQKSEIERAIEKLNRSLTKDLQKHNFESFQHWMQRLAQQTQQPDCFIQAAAMYQQHIYAEKTMSKSDLVHFQKLLKNCASILKKG